MKDLLKKMGVGVVLASTFLYSGCIEPTSYRDKEDFLRNEIELRNAIGDSKIPVIVPLFKLKLEEKSSGFYR